MKELTRQWNLYAHLKTNATRTFIGQRNSCTRFNLANYNSFIMDDLKCKYCRCNLSLTPTHIAAIKNGRNVFCGKLCYSKSRVGKSFNDKGLKMGRPLKDHETLLNLISKGLTPTQINRQTKISRTTIYKYLK